MHGITLQVASQNDFFSSLQSAHCAPRNTG